MSETKKQQGKLAVISGGTTGIGLAAAQLFVKEGAYVFITGRRQRNSTRPCRQLAATLLAFRETLPN
jgi:NAD(P)-dependent dehydrogenase (short-subunit alcohol dehydrogenase family)